MSVWQVRVLFALSQTTRSRTFAMLCEGRTERHQNDILHLAGSRSGHTFAATTHGPQGPEHSRIHVDGQQRHPHLLGFQTQLRHIHLQRRTRVVQENLAHGAPSPAARVDVSGESGWVLDEAGTTTPTTVNAKWRSYGKPHGAELSAWRATARSSAC